MSIMSNFSFNKGGNIIIKSTPKVTKTQDFEIVGVGIIPIETVYDLSGIQEKYHPICLSMIQNRL